MRMKTILILIAILTLLGVLTLSVLAHPSFGLFRPRTSQQRILHSPNWRNGQFNNQLPTPQFTGKQSMFSAMRTMLFDRRSNRYPEQPLHVVKTDLNALPIHSDWLIWFGHSSYMFCLGGKRFLVDPVLTTAFPASLMMQPFKGTDIYHPDDMPFIDYLIVTHEHWDHMDYATLRRLRDKVGHVFCPLGIADYLRLWHYSDSLITEMDWDESITLNDSLTVTCLPTRHFSNRLLNRNQTLWASFMVQKCGRQVYVGGDGGYDHRFRLIRQRFGAVDVAFLENGQYSDNWALIHTTPQDLEKAMLDLQAKQVFTVHHDKFALSMHPWNEPDSVARQIAEKHNLNLLDQPIGQVVPF